MVELRADIVSPLSVRIGLSGWRWTLADQRNRWCLAKATALLFAVLIFPALSTGALASHRRDSETQLFLDMARGCESQGKWGEASTGKRKFWPRTATIPSAQAISSSVCGSAIASTGWVILPLPPRS